MGLRELSHLSHGAVSVSVVIFLRAGRLFSLTYRFPAIFQTADPPRNIKLYSVFLSTHGLAEEAGRLETSLVAMGLNPAVDHTPSGELTMVYC